MTKSGLTVGYSLFEGAWFSRSKNVAVLQNVGCQMMSFSDFAQERFAFIKGTKHTSLGKRSLPSQSTFSNCKPSLLETRVRSVILSPWSLRKQVQTQSDTRITELPLKCKFGTRVID